jgi:hypothetical protein
LRNPREGIHKPTSSGLAEAAASLLERASLASIPRSAGRASRLPSRRYPNEQRALIVTLTQLLGAGRATWPFFGECCFPGIYFVFNIFFFCPAWMPGAGFAETFRLTRAFKNAWAGPRQTLRFAGFALNFLAPAGGDRA